MSAAAMSLTRKHFGLRFAESATERFYRRWRDEHILFLVMMGGGVSMLAWIAIGIGCWLWLPEQAGFTTPVLAAIVAVFAILLSLLGRSAFARLRIPMVMVYTSVLGLVQIWLIMQLGEPASGFALALVAVCASTIFISLMAPVMQLPPLAALIAVAPSVGLVIGLAIYGYQIDLLDRFTAGVVVGLQVLAINFVVVIGLLVDRNNRESFISEMTIESQRESLSRSADLVRRYVPPAVAEHIFDGNEAAIESPQRRRVTVMFADIVGFTDIADRVEPEVMTEVLNAYMSTMAELIEQHGGTLNEFAGDGLMALFGAPNDMPALEQASHAVMAALAMQAKMPALNEAWRLLGVGAVLQTRIGINTGMVSVGSYGSPGRMTYTAIGLQTNIASRIESKAEPGEILISDASYQLVSEHIDCEARGEVECKGVHFPVKVYAPTTTLKA